VALIFEKRPHIRVVLLKWIINSP